MPNPQEEQMESLQKNPEEAKAQRWMECGDFFSNAALVMLEQMDQDQVEVNDELRSNS